MEQVAHPVNLLREEKRREVGWRRPTLKIRAKAKNFCRGGRCHPTERRGDKRNAFCVEEAGAIRPKDAETNEMPSA